MPILVSAGIIVLDPQDRVALVRHRKPGVYDFWVAPGGGVEDGEDICAAASRKAMEEAGLAVEPARLIAIEQLTGIKSGTTSNTGFLHVTTVHRHCELTIP